MIGLLIAVAGGLGAVARFWLDTWVSRRWHAGFPLGTVVINVTGSLALGLLTGWALAHGGAADLRGIVGTGFLGGYTTFSTASVEGARLLLDGRYRAAVVHAGGTVMLGLGAAALGLWLGGL